MSKTLNVCPVSNSAKNSATAGTKWLNTELAACKFKDKRLGKRFQILCEKLANSIGEPIPFACQDWANTKAAYRFLSNDNVKENQIMMGHFQATKTRCLGTEGLILVLQDTTEISYQGIKAANIGSIRVLPKGKNIFGQPQTFTQCGILMHSSLAVTTDGLPLGLTAIKFWTRKKFKGRNSLERKINATRIPIELKESIRWLDNLNESTKLLNIPDRCIHIGDRESDIYELFYAAKEAKTHFLIRTHVDRLAGDGTHTVEDEMVEAKIKGEHRIEVRDSRGNMSKAVLDLKYRRIKVLPSKDKQKKYPELYLTVIHATERNKPKNRERIIWKLITDLPVSSKQDVLEKISWYAMRWKIEVFHKILKSGCRVEDSKLRAAERLVKLISIFCILSWRIFWMTMMNRCCIKASPKIALTATEIKILDKIARKHEASKVKDLSDYLIQLAKLGGYLARNSDPPPGNIVMWRGLSRLMNVEFGFNLAIENCG